MLVLAGAGTGKYDDPSAQRVRRWRRRGVPCRADAAADVHARRAAREMLGPRPASSASPAAPSILARIRFVRANASALGLSPDFTLLDAGDAATLLDLVRQEQGLLRLAGSDFRASRRSSICTPGRSTRRSVHCARCLGVGLSVV